MSTHAWCRDPSRDERVRAAEDGRAAPLPTLGECIDGMFPKSVSASSPVEHENKGDGMRTERVTLEITRPAIANYPAPARQFMWQHLLRDVVQGDRESVRVVEEELSDAWAQRLARLTAERESAIRYLCELSETRCERDEVKARVAALEAASGGGEGSLPDYFVVLNEHGMIVHTSKTVVIDGWGGCTIEPVYKAPPQPRGWLSEDERSGQRRFVEGFQDECEGYCGN